MNTLSRRFFVVAVTAALTGMVVGMGMGMLQDFRLAPAHAHLNLLGWVSMAIFGLFYQFVPGASEGRLPQVHFWLSSTGLSVMIPALALLLLGQSAVEPAVAFGGALSLAGMACFGVVVARAGVAATQKFRIATA
jgi:hypothetical protein